MSTRAKKRDAVWYEGEVLDTTLCLELTEAERTKLEQLKADDARRLESERQEKRKQWSANYIKQMTDSGISEDEARAQINRWIDQQELRGAFALPFDDPKLAGTSVADVLAAPDDYIGKTLSDPFEGPGYGRGKAKLYRHPNGSLFINSFAHGGIKYELKAASTADDDARA